MTDLACRYCTAPMRQKRACGHWNICAKCHAYLWCDGKPPKNAKVAA